MMSKKTNCDDCQYYAYDEDYESYFCEMNLDEDEMARFMTASYDNCPYYRSGNEYRVVRHQM